MLKFLIICPLVFIAGYIDAIAGGGGLISLPAYLIAGIPVHQAIATNKLSATMGTAVSTGKYIMNGFVPWKLVLFGITGAILGSSLGANLSLQTDDLYLKTAMLVILPVTAFYVLKTKSFREEELPVPFLRSALLTIAISFGVGIYDGFYGPGTGTFLILFLTGLGKMTLTRANGLTKIINLTTNVSALTVFLINGQADLLLGLIAGLFGIAGNYLGAGSFTKKGAGFTRPVMIVVLAVFFIKVIVELVQGS